jgi:hypothetical protein
MKLIHTFVPNKFDLKNNKDKIVWSVFSANPNAGDLLKDRAIEQARTKSFVLNKMDPRQNITWHDFYANPSIFVLS